MAELGEQSDITSSPAFAFLEELLAAGKLTSAQAKLYQSKYSKLHEVVLKTYENEKNLLKRAKELNKDLSGERAKLEKAAAAAQEDSDTIAALRAEVGKGESELSMREERELLLQQELHDLQGVRNELQGEVTSTKKKQMAELQPRIDEIESCAFSSLMPPTLASPLALSVCSRAIYFWGGSSTLTRVCALPCAALAEVRGENDKHRAALTRLQQDQEQQKERALALRNAKLETESEKAQLITHLAKVRGEPEKMKKQADIAKTAADSHEGQADKSEIDIKAYEKELNEQMKRRKELEETKMQLVMEAERHRIEISARQAKADDIKKALATANEEAAHAQAERTRLEIEQKALALDGKREQDGLNRRAKEYSNALKRCKRAEVQLQTSQAQVPFMRRQLEETNRQVQTLVEEGKKQHRGIEELKREVDIFINSFLKQEGVESEKQEFLRELLDSIKLLEEELADESRYEQQQRKEVARLTAERETNAREAAKAVSSARETHEELKVKELVIIDLSKKHVETGARLREFSKLYDIVKADRNKYVNQISASAQALAEMKEKIKILQNEVEILRNESVAKDKALSKERLEHQNAFYARDALRAEQNKHMAAEKEKKAQVAQLAAETDNLNSLINGIEKEMLKLKKRYENAVEERNYTGIQLIDRNDELCILYEKSNMQQGVLKKGEVAIREREEEIRMLDLAVAEQCREIEVTRRKLPRVPELEQEIVLLQTQLEEERALAEQLSAELEAPENSKRWRKLEGKDPEPEDLAAKLQVLEERVNDKKEQLLEKDLVLEEVSNLAGRLKAQALEGREETLELAKRVNDFQVRIKSTTRRMMATVSELSMYQASAMKLTQENQAKDESLKAQRANMEHGLPPSEDIEHEWQRFERDLARRAADAEAHNVLQETAPAQLTHTTAEPRPNAYIPDDIGIPKPYGALQPFKPSELGTTMRHTRKPQPREIEL